MKVKVLNLEGWMKKYPEKFPKDYLKEIQPYFNRDGYYLVGDVCWFEYSGKAYFVDGGDFKYEMMLLNTPLYRECEYAAMRLLIKGHIATPQMRRDVWEHDCITNSRKMIRGIRLRRNKALKKYRKKDDNTNNREVV